MFHKSVDSITKNFTKMVNELDKLVQDHTNEIDVSTAIIAKVKLDIADRKVEIDRATAIKEKLNSILSV